MDCAPLAKRRRRGEGEVDSDGESRWEMSPVVVFAHGAGAPSTSEWMIRWKEMMGNALNAVEVITFDYPYISGGKRRAPPKAEKLVDFHADVVKKAIEKYPGHPPNFGWKVNGFQGIGGAIRDEILLKVSVPIMFIQGSKDTLCPLDKLSAVRKKLICVNDLHVVDGGDHSFKIGKKLLQSSGSTQQEAEEEAVKSIAKFVGRTLEEN